MYCQLFMAELAKLLLRGQKTPRSVQRNSVVSYLTEALVYLAHYIGGACLNFKKN